MQARIIRHLTAGGYIETAAAACGVAKPTLYTWMRLGNEEQAGPHRDFLNAVEKALGEAEQRDLGRVGRAAGRNWRAAAWRLERRHPRRWGARVQVSVQQELEAFLEHLEGALDRPTFRKVLEVAAAWDGSPAEREHAGE